MKETLLRQAARLKKKNNQHKHWQKAVSILACIVVFCTVYALILPAVTMEKTAYCGKEEHIHIEKCYEKKLICGKEEGDGAHQHTDDCYREEEVLVCTIPESDGHQHTDDCYTEEEVLTCTNTDPDHVHNEFDGCYTTERVLTCGKEVGEGAHHHGEGCYETKRELVCGQEENEGHHHTEECYKKELICKKEEHTHTLACYSDPDADVESEEQWSRTFANVTLTGNWAKDVVAIAETQTGYTESDRNYTVNEDNTTNGYTRYGQWANMPYADWSATFTSFCLRYANIPESAVPRNTGCEGWNSSMVSPDGYTPKEGDIILLDGNEDGTPEHAGIVTSGSGTSVTAIIGDSDKAVKKNTYATDNAIITGYVPMPENPAMAADDKKEEVTPTPEVTEEPEVTSTPEITEKVTPTPEITEKPEKTPTASSKKPHKVLAKVGTANSNAQNMSGYVTGLAGEGTVYDSKGNLYSTDLKLNFNFPRADIISSGNLSYYYEYEEGIIIPDDLLNIDKELLDANSKTAGMRRFEKTPDGKYRVYITFGQDYVSNAGDNITGYVFFKGQIDGNKADEDGKIDIKGSDNVELVIPKDKITYPDSETNAYDISTSKEGKYEVKDGKLIYTVYVTSVKGTPDNILFEDTIKADNMTLGTPAVTVKKLTAEYFDNNNIKNNEDAQDIDVSYTYENGKLTMTLPKLERAQETDGHKVVNRYKVQYTYDVSNLEGKQPTAENEVKAASKKGETEVKSTSKLKITIRNDYTINKSGWYDASNSRIEWTIDINDNNLDISNASLSDDMLKQIVKGTDVRISPETGYTIEKDSNGKITGIKFVPYENGKNNNKYQIKYYTPAKGTWDSKEVTNTAEFQPEGGSGISKDASVDTKEGNLEKSAGSGTVSNDGKTVVIPWTITVTFPSEGLLAGTVISDDSTKDQYGRSGGNQWMTADQVKKWADNIYWVDSDGKPISNSKLNLTDTAIADVKFTASDGKTYSYTEAVNKTDLVFKMWSVTLNKDLKLPETAKKLIFEYDTTGDLSNAHAGSTYFKNMIQISERKADATYEYKKSGLVKTDENDNANTTVKENEDGTLKWKIKAYLSESCPTLTITDILPDGIKLVNIKGEGNIGGINIDINDENLFYDNYYKITGTYIGNKVEFTLGFTEYHANAGQQLNDKEYSFVLTCKVDKDSITDYVSGQKYVFRNSASAETEKGSIGSAEQTQEWTEKKQTIEEKVVDKAGKWNNNTRRVQYSIKLNPEGKDIVEGSDFLTLKDIFEYGPYVWAAPKGTQSNSNRYNVSAWLINDSIKLYKAVKNADGTLTKDTEITDWKWKVDIVENATEEWQTNSSTIIAENLPDSTPMILEYSYQFQTDIPKGYESTNNMIVKNSATLEGTAYKDNKQQNDTKWADQTDGGGVETDRNYTLYKVCKDAYGTRLPGAEFKLQKYNGTDYTDVAGATYITDKDGKIVIRWQKDATDIQYEYNTLYRVIETKAPNGYVLPGDKQIVKNAIYFYFSSMDTSIANNLPEDMPQNAYDLTKSSYTSYVENETEDVELEIKKKWAYTTADGDVPVNAWENEVKVDVYQETTINNPSGDVDERATLNARFAGWQYISEKHPIGTIINIQVSKTGNADWKPNKPDVTWNGQKMTPDQTIEASAENNWTWTVKYQFVMTETMNSLEVSNYSMNDGTIYTYTEPKSDVKIIKTCVLNSKNSWRTIITGLPRKGTNDEGKTVYYVYYIKEQNVQSGVTVDYENNNGITYGTITVTNKKEKPSDFVLPETGGTGTNRFTAVGLSLMAASLMCEYVMRRKRRERRGK